MPVPPEARVGQEALAPQAPQEERGKAARRDQRDTREAMVRQDRQALREPPDHRGQRAALVQLGPRVQQEPAVRISLPKQITSSTPTLW